MSTTTTILRVAGVLVVTASIALAGAAGVRAADPDSIGGSLSASPNGDVTLTSKSTVAAHVEMVADGPFTLTPSTFTIDPGETVTMTATGDPSGRVTANMSVLEAAVSGETSSISLVVAYPRPAPSSLPWQPVLAGVLALAVLVLVARRVRPWELRVARSTERSRP